MKPWAGVRAVTFDVGGTLIEPWPSVGHVYASVAREFGLEPCDPELLAAQFTAAWKAKAGFDYSRRAWAEVVARAFGGPVSKFGLGTPLFERLYAVFAEPEVWRVYDDVVPALQTLKSRQLKLAVISNWDERLKPLLARLKLSHFFDPIHVSSELGIHKPDREIFLRTVDTLGISPGAVLHVGDSPVEDIAAARGAGMRALLIRRGLGERGKGEIASMHELMAWIGGTAGNAPD